MTTENPTNVTSLPSTEPIPCPQLDNAPKRKFHINRNLLITGALAAAVAVVTLVVKAQNDEAETSESDQTAE